VNVTQIEREREREEREEREQMEEIQSEQFPTITNPHVKKPFTLQ
jgi:hypothetical protein